MNFSNIDVNLPSILKSGIKLGRKRRRHRRGQSIERGKGRTREDRTKAKDGRRGAPL